MSSPAMLSPSRTKARRERSAVRSLRRAPDWTYGLVTVLAVLAAWWIVTSGTGLVSSLYLPSPKELANAFGDIVADGYQGVSLLSHIGISLFRTLTGFLLGSVLGIIVGLAAGYYRPIGAALNPILAFMRPIPPIAFIPLAVLYFGLGETGKIVLILVTAFNYTVVNAQAGAANTPRAYLRASATLGLKRSQEFVRIVLPAALPSIFTGLRVAMALSWAVVVAAELVGAQKGLGFMINYAALQLEIPVVFIGILLIGVIGLLLNQAISLIENRIVHWKGR